MATTVTQGPTSRVSEYPPTSARRKIAATFVTDGTDGASANDIPASLFGLQYIESCEGAVKSDNTLLVACAPAFDGKSLLGKAAGSAAPADIPSGTYSIILEGY